MNTMQGYLPAAMILEELKSLITEHVKPGQYMLSEKWTLEDTLSAIEFGHAKMDRGSVVLNELPLVDFVNDWFDSKNNVGFEEVSLLPLLQMLFRMEMTWYTGRALFSDTILTCILCHHNPHFYAPQSRIAVVIEAAMTVASLVSQLSMAAPVNYEEDFYGNLYGMTWWIAKDEAELERLQERLLAACRESSGMERFYFARYYYWLGFLSLFLKNFVFTEAKVPIVDVIEDLLAIELPVDEEDCSDSFLGSIFFPELANLFGSGCVRPEKRIQSLQTAIRQWNRFLAEDLSSFLETRILNLRPSLNELLQLLAERSRDPLKPPFMAPFRSILFFSILGNRLVYHAFPIETFLLSSAPATLSLQWIPELPSLVHELVQIYCCNASRQRRLLPAWLAAMESALQQQGSDGFGTIAAVWLKDLIDRVRIDMILLLGQLKLLRRDEELEAATHLTSIFEGFGEDGRAVPLQWNDGHVHEFGVSDVVKFKHRWEFLPPSVLEGRSCYDSVLTWLRAMVGAGLTGHSFKQQEWQDDEAITSSQQSQNNYTFTMFTSERDQ